MADGPRYELGGRGAPGLAGLPPLVRAQVTQSIMQQLLTEIVDYSCGGEVILPPGFRDRVGGMKRTIETKFLADDSYRVVAVQMPEEILHFDLGTRWERIEGRKGSETVVLYEVCEPDHGDGYTSLQRVENDELVGMVVSVASDSLRRHVGGWRPWKPSHRHVEEAPGFDG